MKQKKLFILAAAAALLAACSSDDEITAEKQAAQQAAQQEVGFSAYVNRGTTRAGKTGTVTNNNGTSPNYLLQASGFGVFGYYTDGLPYSETATPNFMYNQCVSGLSWQYTPKKYWPNEFGTDAESEGQDKLTFFAYAPWVEVTPGTGRVTGDQTSGIVGLTSNVATGDPYVKYYVDFEPDKRVDLCWGVAAANYTSSVVTGLNNITEGNPYIDVKKPELNTSSSSGKIDFKFYHALASLNVQIDADVDDVRDGSDHGTALDKNTRIWVRSVTFEGFTDKGQLNLNADKTAPLWYELSSSNTAIGSGTVTIHDKRRDGKEGQANAEATNEKPASLNAKFIQSAPYQTYNASTGLKISDDVPGVTNTAVNLFNASDATDPIFVIPTGEDLKVTIVYDVETYDPNVAGYLSDGVTKGSTIENKITKNIQISSENVKLAAGKAYTINLHLGMTSVQFSASVDDWGTGGTSDTDLPINNTTPTP